MNVVEVATSSTTVEVSETTAVVDVTAGTDTVVVNPPDMAYMCAFDMTEQVAANPAATYKINHNQTDGSYAIVNSNGTFTFLRRGTYLINFSVQHLNTSTAEIDTNIFLKKNEQVFPASNSQSTVPPKHGQVPGSSITAVSLMMFFNVNETLELWWQSSGVAATLHTVAAKVSPEIPAAPSIITTIVQVA